MAYCSGCGKALQERSKFCAECGVSTSGTSSQSVRSVRPAPVFVVQPKRGGWLAVKGLLSAFIFAVIFGAASYGNTVTRAVGAVVAFGIGAAYIIINLLRWKSNNEVIKGAGIGWVVVTFLLLICAGNLSIAVGGGATRSFASVANSPIDYPVATPDPKETLLRDVKLDFKWRTDGFGNIMIADFTLKNPTQYRFKDFEIKCTHYAPSGTAIDSNTRTIYQTVEPNSKKVIMEMNMGFINSQASRSGCKISDLVPQ
jgi:hypothetical protein